MGYINITPGGTQTGWIGNDPSGSGLTGSWFNKCWIGGTAVSNAPLVASTSGLTITIPGGTATLSIDGTNFFKVTDSSSGTTIQLNNTGIHASNSGSTTSSSVQNIGFTVISSTNGNSSLNDGALYLRNTQVVGLRQLGPGNPSFSTVSDAQTWCQNLLNALRTHGLVS
jgi:hypothetical protein